MYLSRAKQGAFSSFSLLYIIYLINKKWQGEKLAWGLRRILKMLLNSDNWGHQTCQIPLLYPSSGSTRYTRTILRKAVKAYIKPQEHK
jgi:hypothetical protein